MPDSTTNRTATQSDSIPIRCFTDDHLGPDSAAQRQLDQLARVPGLEQYVAVLPDVHFKSRNPSPTGTVVVSRDRLVPRAVDQGINCGLCMMSTPLTASDLSQGFTDRLFQQLITNIPIKQHARHLVTETEAERMLHDGIEHLHGPFAMPDEEISRIENRGRMVGDLDTEELHEVVSAKTIQKCLGSFGTIGAGNHFLELQEICEVFDQQTAECWNLERGSIVWLLHTDSRRLGKKLLRPLREQAELAFRGEQDSELWSMPVDSEVGRRYVGGLAAASHAGFGNRAAVRFLVRKTLREVTGDDTLEIPLVYDCGHEMIQQETIGDQDWWVHRHGASRALPASQFPGDSVLGQTGQPIPIPGSMGADSYLCVARPAAAQSFHSVAHGAGRVMEKTTAAEQFDPQQVESQLASDNIRLYRYGKDNIAGQAPASFKDAGRVVEVMTHHGLIQPVARLRPRAVLKG